MTTRSIQHQLEDLSRHKFEAILPPQWVFRSKDKDYGIDGEVEIFDAKDRATGVVYLVQLKATRSKKESVIKSIDLKLKTLKYYRDLDLPVLVVRYSSEKDIFYALWAHEIDPFCAKPDAKTLRVKFDDTHIWSNETPSNQEGYLSKLKAAKSGKIRLPVKTSFRFGDDKICGIAVGILKTKIRAAMENQGGVFEITTSNKNAIVQIILDKETLTISLLGVAGCTLHSVALMEKETLAEDLVQDISLGFSIALAQLGYSELAGEIIFSKGLSERLKEKPEALESLFPPLVNTRYFDEILKLVGDYLDNTDNNFLEVLALGNIILSDTRRSTEQVNSLEEFYKRNTERAKQREPALYGISLYNLGNFYRSIGRMKDAARCFLSSRRHASRYYEQGYFFRELASTLFALDKYRSAATFYKKALDLEERQEWRPLYADSLLFSGHYQLSLDAFEAYFSDTCDKTGEWHLKAHCLRTLIEIGGAEQLRNPKMAMNSVADLDMEGNDAENILETALKHDLLCGFLWFNLGVLKSKSGNSEEACFCFIFCALIQQWDIEAWVNATKLSFNLEAPIGQFVLVVQAGYSCNREKYLEALYESIDSQITGEQRDVFSTAIEEIIRDQLAADRDGPPEIRLVNPDGSYENMVLSKSN